MIRLYDDTLSRNGYKVRLLLSHLGRPFDYVPVNITAGQSRTDEFLRKNIAGRIPVLELEDGTLLPESGAMLFYLAQGTPFLPSSAIEAAQVLRWMFFEQNQVECNLGGARAWHKNGREFTLPEAFAQRVAQGAEALGVLNAHLSAHTWLACDRFTIADIAVYGYVSCADEGGFDLSTYPAVAAWLARIAALPAHVGPLWGSPQEPADQPAH